MPVATITLESTNGDSVVVSSPHDDYFDDEIILDTDPQGLYDMGFQVRTASGAFERGGRIVGETVPIREPILPFHLTPESRRRFQRLWGTPGNFQKVRFHYDGPSGRRSLTLKLAKEIVYTTDGGFDADIDDEIHAVVSTLAVNPMYEGAEDAAQWINPDNRFTVDVVARSGTFPLTIGGQTATIPWNATVAQVRSLLEALSSVGAGKVTVTGTPATFENLAVHTPGSYLIVFAAGITAPLTGGSTADLQGVGVLGLTKSVTIGYAPNTGWFELWNPTDQTLWPEWEFDPATQWQFPDWAFGQERRWGRKVGDDAARMVVTASVQSLLSVMSDPFMDTYVCADLSNFAGLMNGVEPIYGVPPYTGSEDSPILVPVVCKGPPGAKATLRQRRFWSAESGLEQ